MCRQAWAHARGDLTNAGAPAESVSCQAASTLSVGSGIGALDDVDWHANAGAATPPRMLPATQHDARGSAPATGHKRPRADGRQPSPAATGPAGRKKPRARRQPDMFHFHIDKTMVIPLGENANTDGAVLVHTSPPGVLGLPWKRSTRFILLFLNKNETY